MASKETAAELLLEIQKYINGCVANIEEASKAKDEAAILDNCAQIEWCYRKFKAAKTKLAQKAAKSA